MMNVPGPQMALPIDLALLPPLDPEALPTLPDAALLPAGARGFADLLADTAPAAPLDAAVPPPETPDIDAPGGEAGAITQAWAMVLVPELANLPLALTPPAPAPPAPALSSLPPGDGLWPLRAATGLQPRFARSPPAVSDWQASLPAPPPAIPSAPPAWLDAARSPAALFDSPRTAPTVAPIAVPIIAALPQSVAQLIGQPTDAGAPVQPAPAPRSALLAVPAAFGDNPALPRGVAKAASGVERAEAPALPAATSGVLPADAAPLLVTPSPAAAPPPADAAPLSPASTAPAPAATPTPASGPVNADPAMAIASDRLGDVAVRLSGSPDQLQVSMQAQPAAAALIGADAARLQQDLAAAGVALAGLSVNGQRADLGANLGANPGGGQRERQRQNARRDETAPIAAARRLSARSPAARPTVSIDRFA